MNIYDMVQTMTEEAARALFRYAYAVPEERRNWRPAPTATSVMEILVENAVVPFAIAAVLRERPQQVNETVWEEASGKAGELGTIEACERACQDGTAELIQALRSIPPGELMQTVMMPWQLRCSLLQAAMSHYWNLTYHLGQIAYIQRLYGDTEFY